MVFCFGPGLLAGVYFCNLVAVINLQIRIYGYTFTLLYLLFYIRPPHLRGPCFKNYCMPDIEKLKRYSDCKGKVKETISESEMDELVKSGKVPHYILQNPLTKAQTYYFAQGELNTWFYENYVHKVNPAEYKLTFLNVVKVFEDKEVPEPLRCIKTLYSIPAEAMFGSSGIYFLCLKGSIVYIGQSYNVSSRIAQHIESKEFDSAYYIMVPREKLDEYETALIRHYDPPLNKGLCPMNKLRLPCTKHIIDSVIQSN